MSTATAPKLAPDAIDDTPITCMICGEKNHYIPKHLQAAHPGTTEESYARAYPGAPMMSAIFQERLTASARKRQQEEDTQQQMVAQIIPFAQPGSVVKRDLHEVFELPLTDSLRKPARRGQTQGDPIQVDVLDGHDHLQLEAIPDVDGDYVFSEEELKDAVMAIQLNLNLLAWGMHGTGKTSFIEQICARTKRPWVRIQHDETTEPAHIVGQMAVRNVNGVAVTEFEYGPLAEAMIYGWLYCADEYDFAHPAVIAVYQAVLEGKPLYIKEAPIGKRLIKPHPNFRFVATGNTNGSGDDTGLYAGTKIGNAAAYSRFGVTIQIHYPAPAVEKSMLKGRLGVTQDAADKLVDFAGSIRTMYQQGELSLPISPRELLSAAKLGLIKGGQFRKGIELAYSNRLDSTQGASVRAAAQRIFT